MVGAGRGGEGRTKRRYEQRGRGKFRGNDRLERIQEERESGKPRKEEMKTERYEGMKQAKTSAKGEVENLAKRKVKGGKQGERERRKAGIQSWET